MTKQCTKCKKLLPVDSFVPNKQKYDGLHNMCKACQKAYNAQYYLRTKEMHKAGRRAASDKQKYALQDFVWDFLTTHPCMDCAESDPLVLEFDHQRDKSYNISYLVNGGYKKETLLAEMQKCEVVCSNCHTRRTAKQFGWRKLKFNKNASVT